jgi:hypothetical protein
MAKQTVSIELEERQIQFLNEMVNNYALPDVGKAVRCLVDYAQESTGEQSTIFEEIRCLDC